MVIFIQKCAARVNESLHVYKRAAEVVVTGCKVTDEHKAALPLSILPGVSSRKRKGVKDAF